MALKKGKSLSLVEQTELLTEILNCINPYITDHSEFDEEEGDRPTNPRWWLKRKGYDPMLWTDWLMSEQSKLIIDTYNQMVVYENLTTANMITGQGMNGDIKMPAMMKYNNAVGYTSTMKKTASEEETRNKKKILLQKNEEDIDRRIKEKLQKIQLN